MQTPNEKPMAKAVFWDRDGTLMEEVDYCGSPDRVKAILGAGRALKALQEAGWLNVLITNQSGIGRGYFSVSDYEAVNAELVRQLGIGLDGIYFSPDVEASPRRKPATGMVEEACKDLGIDPAKSWFVGDKASDIDCGKAAGCRTILVLTGYGKHHTDCNPDRISEDAGQAAAEILAFKT